MIGPEIVSAPIPPFANSPSIRQKHRYLDRYNSSSVSLRLPDTSDTRKDNASSVKWHESLGGSSVPEVAVASILSSDKFSQITESHSLTRGEGRRHKKSFKTSSAPEKMRLLANSFNIINDVGNKRKTEKGAELAETRSLLENPLAVDESSGITSSPKTNRSCSSPISLSTPHSLHLCEKSSKDTSPCGEDSDYFTPEDPNTSILVEQGTDTSLDAPQGMKSGSIYSFVAKVKGDCYISGTHEVNREKFVVNESENGFRYVHDKRKRNSVPLNKPENPLGSLISPKSYSLVVNLENHKSLPGTPASNISNHSSAESFGSTSSTRLLLKPQSYDTLQE